MTCATCVIRRIPAKEKAILATHAKMTLTVRRRFFRETETMHILECGLGPDRLQKLAPYRFNITSMPAPTDVETVVDWLAVKKYCAFVVYIPSSGIGPKTVATLRKRGIVLPIIGIDAYSPPENWPDQCSLFLEHGGDDVVSSPFSGRELAARIHASVRRLKNSLINCNLCKLNGMELVVDRENSTAHLDNRMVALTPTMFNVLEVLATANGRRVTRSQIIEKVASLGESEVDDRAVDSNIKHIRLRLRRMNVWADAFIKTEYGYGYRMNRDEGSLQYALRAP